jgi:phosphoglycolate phosphatase
MRAFDAVIFDYDGTLFDTRPAIVHCIQRVFEESGRPIPALEAIMDTVRSGIALQDTFAILDAGLRSDRVALQEHVKAYRAIYLAEATPRLKPFAGVEKVVQQIHGAGAKCLVVSNKGVAAIRRSFDQSGLTACIDMIMGDEPGRPRKPDPTLMTQHILPSYPQLRLERTLMVGDTETDIQFAKAGGVSCCWVSYGYGEPERCRALGPDYEISNIVELPALVLNGSA